MQQSPPGYSILVVEGEPFIVRCLQIVLPYRREARPNAPVMGKLASGAQIVEALRGLLQPPQASASAVAGVTDAGASAQMPHTRAMAGVDALMKRRRSVRLPPRQSPL